MENVQCAYEAALLGMESSIVAGLRLAAFWTGAPTAAFEALEMVTEKLFASTQAALRLGAGATARDVIGDYRDIVHANRLRLMAA